MKTKLFTIILVQLLLMACITNKAIVAPQEKFEADTFSIDQTKLIEHLKTISSDEFTGRKIGTLGNLKSRNYLESQLKKYNVAPFIDSYHHKFINHYFLKDVIGDNIIGVVEGVDFPNEYIVLTAHFDHLGIKGDVIYNGADDNASGTAALLSLAREISLTPLRYSVLFLFTDGEESNLLGAKAFLRDFDSVVPAIKLNINLDMIAGNNNTSTLHFITRGVHNLMSDIDYQNLQNQLYNSEVNIKKGFKFASNVRNIGRGRHKWLISSDHGVFYRKKIPFIYFGVGTHENYHTSKDTFDNINQSFYISATQSIYQYILMLDQYI